MRDQTPSLEPQIDYEILWAGIWGDMQRYGPIHRHHRRIFDTMIQQIPSNEIHTVADVGCGEGSNLAYLQHRFPHARLFGFDLSYTALQYAKARVQAHLVVADIQTNCTAQQQFDLVVCSDVLEHIEDDMAAIHTIYTVTRKYALIASVQGDIREFEYRIGHVRSYAYGELQAKLKIAGFHILSVVEWGFPLYSPLYRNLLNIRLVEHATHGRYGVVRKLLCHVLYAMFFLNMHTKGDIIFVLACRNEVNR
ncbi:MAG: class I SAM-dependent methyltransferase [Ardenticatenia bacterium]|nr:class I SAM-dependent methyltransferase [Ardenticatenia bacterium]